VFVVQDDRARIATIEVGRRGSVDAEILSGLHEGSTVVLHPPDTLGDNARVAVRTTSRR
jgi:HlyD family secretion protein